MAKIGLDIGHGVNTFPPNKGVYRGGKGYAEHSFNAQLGKRIKELLEANGHTVIMGQQPNKKDVPLTTRTNLYNREKVDIVVSLHANAGASSVEGRCVFYWGTSSKGRRLATHIRDEIKKAGYSTHGDGLHAGVLGTWTNLHITRETNMPAVLIEHGFMTNNKDFELIFGSKQAQYIEDMAVADVKGIQKYFGQNFKSDKPSKSKPTASKPKANPKIRTGGLNEANMNKVTRWLKENTDGWYYTFRGSGGNNPVLRTGGLNAAARKKFGAWLDGEGLWWTTEYTANHRTPTSNNIQIRTGGLSTQGAVGLVSAWLTRNKCYFVGISSRGNPVIVTGGMGTRISKEFTDLLDEHGLWWRTV
ncbi:N-acetylmuramoyl-L-alanine amidase family protein [Oceanobacillus alkalisoli]|uniref:N-acetylmuramoyl-L-alanine amidase family protein n=1 Tax=Oceanobacillus alkalisoli TaxID=2925113 RepID=UPI001F11CF3A|nr:N-acetylmuramoyl-L-alanine amidase [Oceanobacillus alkalisoli]MCF3941558.1 N-acetylmuramoyl-L-alanine amidase [Oceanobacillus alkalisoli]